MHYGDSTQQNVPKSESNVPRVPGAGSLIMESHEKGGSTAECVNKALNTDQFERYGLSQNGHEGHLGERVRPRVCAHSRPFPARPCLGNEAAAPASSHMACPVQEPSLP